MIALTEVKRVPTPAVLKKRTAEEHAYAFRYGPDTLGYIYKTTSESISLSQVMRGSMAGKMVNVRASTEVHWYGVLQEDASGRTLGSYKRRRDVEEEMRRVTFSWRQIPPWAGRVLRHLHIPIEVPQNRGDIAMLKMGTTKNGGSGLHKDGKLILPPNQHPGVLAHEIGHAVAFAHLHPDVTSRPRDEWGMSPQDNSEDEVFALCAQLAICDRRRLGNVKALYEYACGIYSGMPESLDAALTRGNDLLQKVGVSHLVEN